MVPLPISRATTSEAPMFGFRFTVKPLARRARAYSSPRIRLSVKFLVPSVTAGLPLPAPVAVELRVESAGASLWTEVAGDEDDPQPAVARAIIAAAGHAQRSIRDLARTVLPPPAGLKVGTLTATAARGVTRGVRVRTTAPPREEVPGR